MAQGQVSRFTKNTIKQATLGAVSATAVSKALSSLEDYINQQAPVFASLKNSIHEDYVFDGIAVLQETFTNGIGDGVRELGRRSFCHIANYGAEKVAEKAKQNEDIPGYLHIPLQYVIKLGHKPVADWLSKVVFGDHASTRSLANALESMDKSVREEYMHLLREAFEVLSSKSSKL